MKHVQRRHFFIRDMVESFEIEVPFVRTADNIADFFTKPSSSRSGITRTFFRPMYWPILLTSRPSSSR